MFNFIVLPRLTAPTLAPVTLRRLKALVRDLRAQGTLSLQEQPVVYGGKVFLAALCALRPPVRGLAPWVRTQLDRAEPGFFEACVAKQAAGAAARTAARKRGDKAPPAPLAGVLVGGKERYPALYAAFFDAVKAGVITGHQTRALAEGLSFAGVKSGDKVGVGSLDFMDPFTVTTQEGCGTDFRAEGALLRLTKSRMELGRVQDGEEVRSKAEEGTEEAKQFAHSEFQLIPEDLLQAVQEHEGLIIPWDASPRDARALAESITDPHLQARVLAALDQGDEVDDRERVYLHAGGDVAFRVRKTPYAAPWKPFEPTPATGEAAPAVDDSVSPFAGWSAFSEDAARPKRASAPALGRVVSQETYDAMQAKLSALRTRADEIAVLMADALEDGDLRESAAYDEARAMMFENQDAIAKAELDLLDVTVGDVAASNIGKHLTVRIDGQSRQIRLTDNQPSIGEVSVETPLGQALLHAQPGQTFAVAFARPASRRIRVRQPVREDTFTVVKRHVPSGMPQPILPDVRRTYRMQSQDFRWSTNETIQHHVEVLALA